MTSGRTVDGLCRLGRAGALGLLLVLTGCGGGGGGSNGEAGPATNGETAVPGADYFPLNVGDRWLYADGSNVASITDVTGTRSVTSGTAMVVHTVDQDGPSDAVYLKTASAVTVVPDGSDPVQAAIGPMQVLRLPLITGDRWVLADKTLTAVADIDGDGRPEDVAVRIEATVIGFETVSTPAGSYNRAAHVRTVLTRSARLTRTGQAYSDTSTSDDWLAPDIGPVRNLLTLSDGSATQRTDSLLTGWRVAGRRNESVAPTLDTRTPAPGTLVFGSFPLLTVRFSEKMDTRVAGASLWTLTGPDGQPVSGEAQWQPDGASLVFSHPNSLASGHYTARVSTVAADLVGNPLAAEAVWTFDVDSSGPAATPVSPLAGATEVPLDSTVVFTLDEDPDPSSVNTGTVLLADLVASQYVDATVTLSGRTVTLQPKSALRTGGRYQVTVSGIADLHGNRGFSSQGWAFSADPGRFAAPQRLIDSNGVTAVAIGDVDGDGRADVLMATGYDGGSADGFTLFVRRGLGGGNFAPAQRYATISAYGSEIGTMTVADLDGNGRPAVIVGAAGRGIQIFRRQPDGTLASSQVIDTAASTVVRVADMDGDGRLDLVGAPFAGSTVSVWLQGPGGRFDARTDLPVPVGSFGDMAVGDLDGDGRPDIAVISGGAPDQPVGVVLRLADGGYAAPTYPSVQALSDRSVTGLTIGDVTGDGRADLVLLQSFSSRITVLAQRAGGGFAEPVSLRGASNATHARVVDVDGDGRADVVSWSWGGYPIALNRRRTDGSLGGVETWPVADYGIWTPDLAAVGDLDGDGRPDLVYGSAWLRQRNVPSTPPPVATLVQVPTSRALGARSLPTRRAATLAITRPAVASR